MDQTKDMQEEIERHYHDDAPPRRYEPLPHPMEDENGDDIRRLRP